MPPRRESLDLLAGKICADSPRYCLRSDPTINSSTIAELVATAPSYVHLDRQALDEFLVFGRIGSTRTLYSEIARDTCDYGGRPTAASPLPSRSTEEAVLTALRNAVESRLDRSAPTAVELSGGLDSSTVTALARASGAHIVTATGAFSGVRSSEHEFYSLMLDDRSVVMAPDPLTWTDLVDFSSRTKTLCPTPESMSLLPLLRVVADRGCRTLLTGQGGDHLFAATNFSELSLLCSGRVRAALPSGGFHPRSMARHVRRILRDVPTVRRGRSHGFGVASVSVIPADRRELLDHEILGRGSGSLRNAASDVRMWSLAGIRTRAETWAATAADAGLVVRHPFLDPGLVALVLSLDESVRLDSPDRRVLQRAIIKGLVPEQIRQRRGKAEFSDMFMSAFEQVQVSKHLRDPAVADLGLVDPAFVARLVKASQGEDLADVPTWPSILWRVVQIEALVRASPGVALEFNLQRTEDRGPGTDRQTVLG